MIKKLLFFSLIISGPTIRAMEEVFEEVIEKNLWEATILAQQEEFKKVLAFFIEKVKPLTDLFASQRKKYAETEFLKQYRLSFQDIKNYHTVATVIRDRKLIEKIRGFTPEDKLYIQRYLRSHNSEIKSIGEILNYSVLIDEAEPEAYKAYSLLGIFLTNFENANKKVPEKFKKPMEEKNLLTLAQIVVKILPKWFGGPQAGLTPEESMRHIEIAERIIQKYQESYEKINEHYKIAALLIRKLPPLQEHFHEYLTIGPSGGWKPFPASLDNIIVPEIKKEEQKVAPVPEPKEPKKKPIRKPKRKERPTPKPEKPIEEVAPEIPEEVEAEIPEEIEVEEVEHTYPELAKWFNENFKAADGSSVSFIDDYQIIIEDPKNNAQVVLYRKSQDDKKTITPAMPYTDRVKQWFTDPQKALEDGSYTIKFKTQKKLDEMAARHNFAQITDAFIDKEGVSETHIDEKKRKIPVKLLAGELRLRQPDGSVETVSGIFSYGRLPKANKYYHRYLHEKEYGQIAQEYYADAKWQVDFPPLS